MVVPLPTECIQDILFFVKKKRELYSCLFVNRTWCRIAIPLLWSKPFVEGIKNPHNYTILNNYFANINEEEKSILVFEFGTELPFFNKSTLFDYIKYLEVLDLITLIDIVTNWVFPGLYRSEYNSHPKIQKTSRVIEVLAKLITRKSVNIKKLRYISSGFLLNYSVHTTHFHSIISNITHLKIHGRPPFNCAKKFFRNVFKLCRKIEYLNLNIQYQLFEPFIDLIHQIINNQNSIKSLKIRSNWSQNYQYLDFGQNSMKNLNFIDLINHKINLGDLLSSLSYNQCSKLYLKNCKLELDKLDIDSLTIRKIPIYNLQIINNENYEHQFLILRFAAKFLRNLHLSNLTNETVETIIKYCPNIINFTLEYLSKQHIPLLFNILDNLKLQGLHLSLIHNCSFDLNASMIFDNLSLHLPSTLVNLYLEASTYTAYEIYNFLRNYQSSSLTHLIIFDKYLFKNPTDKLQVFLNFILHNKILKVFGIEFEGNLVDKYSIEYVNSFEYKFRKEEKENYDYETIRKFKYLHKEGGIYGIYIISSPSKLQDFSEYLSAEIQRMREIRVFGQFT